MKTLIDYAIAIGNEERIGFTNETQIGNETKNENISKFCSKNEHRNETNTSHTFRNENSVEMNGYITQKWTGKYGGNEQQYITMICLRIYRGNEHAH